MSKNTALSTWNNLYKKNSVSFNGMHGGHRSIILDSTVVKRAMGPCNLLQLTQAAEVQVQSKGILDFGRKILRKVHLRVIPCHCEVILDDLPRSR